MIRRHWLSVTVGLSAAALLGCGDDGGDAPGGTSIARARVAEALTAGISVANGTVNLLEDEDLPESTVVSLVISQEDEPVNLVPDEVSILEYDVENPEEDDEVVATLLQFEESEDTLEISDLEAEGDAGGDSTHFSIDLRASGSICDDLCADEFELNVFMKAKLRGGGIGARAMRRVKLDCRQAAKSCEDEEPSGDGDGDGDGDTPGDGDGDGDGPSPATLGGQFLNAVLPIETALCECAGMTPLAECETAVQWLGSEERGCVRDAIEAGDTGGVSALIAGLNRIDEASCPDRSTIFEMALTTQAARDALPMSIVDCDEDQNSFVTAGSVAPDAGTP